VKFNVETAAVRFEPSGQETVVPRDSNLMDAILQAGLPLGQSCDGVTLCGFCRVTVLDGLSSLSPTGTEEQRVLASFRAGADERLACCAQVLGPVTVTADYW
jgi:ferredoxin